MVAMARSYWSSTSFGQHHAGHSCGIGMVAARRAYMAVIRHANKSKLQQVLGACAVFAVIVGLYRKYAIFVRQDCVQHLPMHSLNFSLRCTDLERPSSLSHTLLCHINTAGYVVQRYCKQASRTICKVVNLCGALEQALKSVPPNLLRTAWPVEFHEQLCGWQMSA